MSLTAEEKLVKLGLRSSVSTTSSSAGIITVLQNNIAESWDTFQELFEDEGMSSWGDFETWLTNNGVSSDTAGNIRTQLESKFSTWSDFSSAVINDYSSWQDFADGTGSSSSGVRSERTTDDGQSAAGIKVYNEAGTGRNGQAIPAGGVEVFGTEVHFSEVTNLQDTKEESAGSNDVISYANLSVSTTSTTVNSIVTVDADVTNNTSFQIPSTTVELIVDSTVITTKEVGISANGTVNVSFDWVPTTTGVKAVAIGDLTPIDVTVEYSGTI